MLVSIIIPSYNACKRLYYNLVSLCFQDYPSNYFEVIIVDNQSNDDTAEMLYSFHPNYNMRVFRVKEKTNRAAARNLGVQSASGSLVIFHDSDMIAEKNFISKHVKEHKNDSTVVSGANWKRIYSFYYNEFSTSQKKDFCIYLKNTNLRNRFLQNNGTVISKEYIENDVFIKYSFELQPYSTATEKIISKYGEDLIGYHFPWRFFITNNCSIYRNNLFKAGLFDENFNGWGCEDVELGYRLYKHGLKFVKRQNILSVHQEHPIKVNDDGLKNILYFIDKYQTTDLMLFYLWQYTAIKESWLNDIINDIETIRSAGQYNDLTKLFNLMLIEIKNKLFRENSLVCNQSVAIKNHLYELGIDIKTIIKQLNELSNKYNINYFVKAFKLLIKDLYTSVKKNDF